MSVLFVAISAIPIGIAISSSIHKKRLRNSGRKLTAVVEEIAVNTSQKVNGQHPYVIYCTWRDEYRNIVYRFKSNSIWTNPNLVLFPGDSIPVYVDEKNYKHYYVDTESILKDRIVDFT